MSSAIKSLCRCVDKILGVREQVGADLKKAYIVTRTWSGDRPGNGYPTDTKIQVLPTPRVVDFSHSVSLREAGAIKSGDILLEKVPKTQFPQETDINGYSDSRCVEKLYDLSGELYKAVSVVEKLLWWNVQIRRLSAQERYD
jgi:hypothetical protein